MADFGHRHDIRVADFGHGMVGLSLQGRLMSCRGCFFTGPRLGFFPCQTLQFRTKVRIRVAPSCTPDAIGAVSRFAPCCSRSGSKQLQ